MESGPYLELLRKERTSATQTLQACGKTGTKFWFFGHLKESFTGVLTVNATGEILPLDNCKGQVSLQKWEMQDFPIAYRYFKEKCYNNKQKMKSHMKDIVVPALGTEDHQCDDLHQPRKKGSPFSLAVQTFLCRAWICYKSRISLVKARLSQHRYLIAKRGIKRRLNRYFMIRYRCCFS